MTLIANKETIQSMFNHLAVSYSADEAREILVQKYPEMEAEINEIQLTVDPSKYGVTTVEMGKVVKRTEAGTGNDLTEAVKAKTKKAAKPKAEKAPKAESKADIARKLYAEAKDQSRGAMIKVFMDKLGMSKAAASTYYYNVKG